MPYADTLGPVQAIGAIREKFHVSFRNMCRCVSAPKMLECHRAFRLFKMRDAETPEDVEATHGVFQTLEDGMKAVLQCVGLEELTTSADAEQQALGARAHESAQRVRESANATGSRVDDLATAPTTSLLPDAHGGGACDGVKWHCLVVGFIKPIPGVKQEENPNAQNPSCDTQSTCENP
jgi:hypothetical protein